MVVHIMNTMFYLCEKEMGVYRIRSSDLGAKSWLLYNLCVWNNNNLGLENYGCDSYYAYL